MSRIVLITGVTRGLGRALALSLAGRGHRILGCGRSLDDLNTLARDLGRGHSLQQVDVASWEEVSDWAERLADAGQVPDLVVNNAALINENAPLWQVPVEEFSKVVDVNVKGVFHVIRAFLPKMLEAGQGIVVNLSSGWGRSASPEVAPYCATKFAIEGLTAALAEELPRGFAAVALNPGVIRTEMLESTMGEAAAGYPDPEAWAQRAVPYLLSFTPRDNGRAATVP